MRRIYGVMWMASMVLELAAMVASGVMPQLFYFENTYPCEVSGIPYNGTNAAIRIQIFNQADAGPCLYEETNIVVISDGYYGILIGEYPVSGSLASALADGQAYIQTCINGNTQAIRELILPAPFALRSAALASNATISASMIPTASISADKLASDVDNRYVLKTGDTVTGPLTIEGQLIAGGSTIQLGDAAQASGNSLAIGGASCGQNYAIAIGYMATSSYNSISVGRVAKSFNSGTAFGTGAQAYDRSTALGRSTVATKDSVALGYLSQGIDCGCAIGYYAKAYTNAIAIGGESRATKAGLAIGYMSKGFQCGTAIGIWANAQDTNIAIGPFTSATGGIHRIALGECVVNDVDNSARIRGNLYLDGATDIRYRPVFGNGEWTSLSDEYLKKSGGIVESLTVTNTLIANRLEISYIPPQGGLSMGVFTNR